MGTRTDRRGPGRDVSPFESALGLVAYHLVGYLGSGVAPARLGTEFPSIAPYGVFATSDGEMMVAAANDRLLPHP